MLPPGVLESMPFERTAVDAEGVTVSVVDDGPPNAAETLLFLHGNPAWSYLWRRPLAAARAAGHRVVAPDLAGFGLSDKPERPEWYSPERHVACLETVVKELDVRNATLVVHDWGGPLGLALAGRHPERFRRLVVANTSAFAPRQARPLSKWHRFFASPAGFALGVNLNLIAWSAFLFGVRRRLPGPVRRAYLWPMKARGARMAAARFVQMVPDRPDHPTVPFLREVEANFARLQEKPMLVLWADADPVFRPRLAERWREAFPNADVRHVAPEAGHFWQEDAPGPFVEAMLAFVGETRYVE